MKGMILENRSKVFEPGDVGKQEKQFNKPAKEK